MDPQTFLPPKVGRLDLTSREKKVGDIVHIDMGYVEAVSPPGDNRFRVTRSTTSLPRVC